ncbi:MAG: hypothetical protein GY757_13950 [bacterium]|nr:hypothetical protein [bacterium]
MVRAVREGIYFKTRGIVEVYRPLKIPVKDLRIAGGASVIPFWTQMQADIYNKAVSALKCDQASLLGAAMLAARGAGVFQDLKEAASKMVRFAEKYVPDPKKAAKYNNLFKKQRNGFKVMNRNGLFNRAT